MLLRNVDLSKYHIMKHYNNLTFSTGPSVILNIAINIGCALNFPCNVMILRLTSTWVVKLI